ncbi:hypothetical protein JHK82_016205 [Glycine max]|nr:hypothetical protein JHK85_016606 [Glycine max]KAG5046830.1 hypothetical protein JHK86_016236 [Glycine max]KAG5149324.1 hypothetical protein JHK82_016205 [Glycine max]
MVNNNSKEYDDGSAILYKIVGSSALELQLQDLNESEAARVTLESLESDVKKANNLV